MYNIIEMFIVTLLVMARVIICELKESMSLMYY